MLALRDRGRAAVSELRAFWTADLALALRTNNMLRFYVALGQLGTVKARER